MHAIIRVFGKRIHRLTTEYAGSCSVGGMSAGCTPERQMVEIVMKTTDFNEKSHENDVFWSKIQIVNLFESRFDRKV